MNTYDECPLCEDAIFHVCEREFCMQSPSNPDEYIHKVRSCYAAPLEQKGVMNFARLPYHPAPQAMQDLAPAGWRSEGRSRTSARLHSFTSPVLH